MNKKLLAVAIGTALSAPMLAQADVKVTGSLNVSADYVDIQTSATTFAKQWNVSSNSSFFKIEANEDLGGGMKALASIQEFVRMDHTAGANTANGANFSNIGQWTTFGLGTATLNGSRTANNKNTSRLTDGEAFVGLSGGFGTVLMGSLDTPAKKNGRLADLFGNALGDSRNLDVNNNRAQNTIAYASPSLGGVTITVAHSTNLDNSSIGQNRAFQPNNGTDIATTAAASSIGVVYSGGPVTVGVVREYMYDNSRANSVADDETWTSLAGSFDVGPATIKAFYQNHENIGYNPLANKTVMGLGGAFKFGKETVKLQYYKLSDDAVNKDANMYAIGFDHAFSKTTTAYVAYASTENDTGAKYSMAAGGHGDQPNTVNGESMSGLSLGMIMNF